MPASKIKPGKIYVQVNVIGRGKYIKAISATKEDVVHEHCFAMLGQRKSGSVTKDLVRPLTPEEKLEYAVLSL